MIYVFENYELNLRLYELRYAGKPVKLEPQVFNLLAYLIQHRNRVVPKQELFDHLWPNQFVSEATLSHRLMQARKAVGDTGRMQSIIQTVHSRGYRFIAPVEERLYEIQSPIEHSLSNPSVQPIAQRKRTTTSGLPSSKEGPSSLAPRESVSGRRQSVSAVYTVGREKELDRLHQWLHKAVNGTRQIVFVAGEAGVGKTTLLETFLTEVWDYGTLWIGRGQCIEHYGAGEAYLPVLEALSRLCREPAGEEFLAFLIHQAPTWVLQMPWLLKPVELEALQRQIVGTTRERMLRELAEAIEVLTSEKPLILVLEDLHWSDYATLDLVTLLAQRREPARFLLLGTYRPEVVKARSHPLYTVVQSLHLHHNCAELSLTLLHMKEVQTYLRSRFGSDALATTLGPLLHRRTEGNPLFLNNMVEHWVTQGWLYQQAGQWVLHTGWEKMEQEIPATLREVIIQRRALLNPTEQRLLEVASVAGMEFSAASVAAGLASDVVETEEWCEALAQREQFIQSRGVETWPDGTVATRYQFRHILYQNIGYEQVPAARRMQLHQRIGTREEAGYGTRCGEIAARLAMHFERGNDLPKAIRYYYQAAQQAIQRSGFQEAIAHLTHGLDMLRQLPDALERREQELAFQITLGSVLRVTQGYGAPEVEHAYRRAYELCQHLGDSPQLFSVLYSLYELYEYRGIFQQSREIGEQLLHLAHRQQDTKLLLGAHEALACTTFHLGTFAQVLEHTEQGLTLYDPQQHHALTALYGRDLGISCRYWSAMALWFQGYPDQAWTKNTEALTFAQKLVHPYTVAVAHNRAAFLGQFRREIHTTRQWAEVAIDLAAQHGFLYHAAMGMILRGWTLARTEQGKTGIAQIREGLVALRETGREMDRPYFLALLAEAYSHTGQIEQGLITLTEALEILPSERDFFYKAELYRLKGELLLTQEREKDKGRGQKGEKAKREKGEERRETEDEGQKTEENREQVVEALLAAPLLGRTSPAPTKEEAEVCFQEALAIARRQQAKSLELRAAVSLSRLWQQQGKHEAAQKLLSPIYHWFTEGWDTLDLQEAKALLEELASNL